MNPQAAAPIDEATDDPRVIAALDEFLAVTEAGRKVDRVAFLAARAEIAGPLAKCLDGLDFVQSAAPGLQSPGDVVEPGQTMPLGDFQLLREIGRGGMGVVYEAEQLSLGRRVAVKVLPFAAALDPRQLERFKHEAQAAAQLQHPHIVPVYGVGCERGVHYYAMQLIDGRSMAQVIRELREQAGLEGDAPAAPDACAHGSPGAVEAQGKTHAGLTTENSQQDRSFFCRAAQLAFQAALALEHAHQVGVTHRDVKPANLLLERSSVSHGDGGARPHLWITDFGLAQFHGQAGLTMTGDVLGTLRYMSPEQASARREVIDHRTDIYSLGATLYEMLTLQPALAGNDRQALVRQITEAEPVPPRQLQPALPLDLETIVLKALAKVPAERYATAQEMADDLQRFLDDRPIQARRPTLVQRAAKTVRRNRTFFATLILGLIVTLAVAVVILAVSARRLADREAQIKASYEEAKVQQKRAEQNFQRAMDTVDLFLTRVSRDVAMQPQARRRLLLDAQSFLAPLHGSSADPSLRLQHAGAHRRLATIASFLGDAAAQTKHLQSGLSLSEALVAEFPKEPRYLLEFATQCFEFAWHTRHDAERRQQCEHLFQRALGACDELVALEPSAVNRFRRAHTQHKYAYALWSNDRMREAEEWYRRALADLESLVRAEPAAQQYRSDLQDALISFGILLRQADRLAEAEQVSRQALAIVEESAKRDPASDYRDSMARTLAHLSAILWRQRRHDDAENTIARALALREARLADRPTEYDHMEWAMTAYGYGVWLSMLGRPKEAEHHLRVAAHAVEKVRAFGDSPNLGVQAGLTQTTLGGFLYDAGRTDEAAVALAAAHSAYSNALERFPQDPELHGRFAWFLLTCPDPKLRDVDRGLAVAQKAVELGPGRVQGWLALGLARHRLGDHAAAVADLEKSARLRSGDGDVGGFILAMAQWRLGNHDAAREQLRRTTSWMEQKKPDHPELQRFQAEAEKLIGN